MNKTWWVLIGFVLVDTFGSFIRGKATIIAFIFGKISPTFGNTITTVLFVIGSITALIWGLLRLFRGGGMGEGLMVIAAVLAANYFAGGTGYSSIFDAVIKRFMDNPKLWGGILLALLILSARFRGYFKSLWNRSKGEPKPEKEKKARKKIILDEGISRLWVKALRRLRRRTVTAKVVGDWLNIQDPYLPGELLFSLKELRLEIYTLMNMMLRHEIFKAKSEKQRKIASIFQVAEQLMTDRVPTRENVHKEMKQFIEGGGFEKKDGKWVLKPPVGFARQYVKILEIMNKLKADLENQEQLTQPPPGTPKDEVNKFLETQEKDFLNPHFKDMETVYNTRYKASVEKFKVANLLRAYRLWFLDMYNLYGEYKRGYGFAKLGTIPRLCTYEIKGDKNQREKVQEEINWDSVIEVGIGEGLFGEPAGYEPGTNLLVEVDLYGYAVSDINAIQIEKRGLRHIRKFKREDIVYLHKPVFETNGGVHYPAGNPKFSELMNWSYRDWSFFVDDYERGIFHPYSKSISDYNVIATLPNLRGERSPVYGYMRFSAAIFKKQLSLDETGFDREALRNPGKFVYWGRKHYWGNDRTSLRLFPVNPYPVASMKGLWDFINMVAKRRSGEKLAGLYLEYFKSGYAALEEIQEQPAGGAT